MSLSLRHVWGVAAASLVALTLAAPAHASALGAGGLLLPVPQRTDPIAGTVVDSLSSGFVAPSAYSGILRSVVLSDEVNNPLGGLTFLYEILNDGVAGPNSIGRLSIDSYGGIDTDVEYLLDDGTVAPAYADRGISGSIVGFNFFPYAGDPHSGFLDTGEISSVLIVHTNARAYRTVLASIIDGSISQAESFGPVVPEPSTLALLGLSAVGIGGVVWRRKARG